MRYKEIAARLRSRIEGGWPVGHKLPPLIVLAQDFGTSVPTMIKALAILKRDRVLEDRPSGFSYRVNVPVDSSTPAALRSERLADELKQEILVGRLPYGEPLPPLKELQRRHNCAHATLRRALHLLERDWGLIEPFGTGYRPGPVPAGTARSRIVICGSPRVTRSYRSVIFHVIKSLEREIQLLGWDPPEYLLSDDPLRVKASQGSSVAAFVHIEHGATTGWGTFLRKRPEIPVVRIDMEELSRGRFPRHRFFVRVAPSNRIAGCAVAAHLWQLGHRRIAFLSHIDPERFAWAGKRVEGILSIFSAANDRGSHARTFTPDKSAPVKGNGSRLAGLGQLRAAVSSSKLLHETAIDIGLGPVHDLVASEEISRTMVHVFDDTLGNRDITAWVCVNDQLASCALAYLRRRGVAVPRDMSLVSFDNSPFSFAAAITSFDFDEASFGVTAARALATGSSGRSEQTVVVRGQLVVRNSSRAVGTRGAVPRRSPPGRATAQDSER